MTLFYVPLEGYKERYTLQWSAPKTGWLERNWIKAKVDYRRIEGSVMARNGVQSPPNTIKTGSVVDGVGRSRFCFDQISQILGLAEAGHIRDSDVLFFDDFWTPGLEALPYAFHLLDIRPRMYAFLHAQSVDEFDFTWPMRNWMRPIETGFASALEGIFVCCPTLKDLVVFGGIAPREKIHVTGHPFNSEEVMERMTSSYRRFMGVSGGTQHTLPMGPRLNQVVWSSRWDTEKNPWFFLKVADQVIKAKPDTKFIVCTSAPKLRSNNQEWIKQLDIYRAKYPNNVELRENLSKEEYYATLVESKIQFNCADQDFVAITLLEASVAGCWPIYPYFRSFPETFLNQSGFMYERLNLDQAAAMICNILDNDDLWTAEKIRRREWIHRRFDRSWIRMLRAMGITNNQVTTHEWVAAAYNPYDPVQVFHRPSHLQ